MQALILVGGFATRLRPFTDNRPKALIPILNKPMIMHLIDKVQGIVDEVILAVNYGKEQLEEYFESHDCGVKVTLHPETEPLGTGGAIKNAEKLKLPVTEEEAPPGTTELANEVLAILDDNNFIVVKNGGFVSLGKNMKEAGELTLNILNKKQKLK